MDFGPEMMFGVVAIVKKDPIVDFAVTAYAPRHRFVRIRAVMPIIPVQITETVTEIEKRQEIKDHVVPIEEKHHEERGRERGQLNVSPEKVAIVTFAKFGADGAEVVAKEA